MGYFYNYGMMGQGIGFGFSPWLIIILAWALYWKGRSLWRAARLGQLEWFIALLILNTAGLLDIAYLYYFTKEEDEKKKHVENKE